MPKHKRTSVVHNLMLREIHGNTNRGYSDFDERIVKQIHKSRAVNGPRNLLEIDETRSCRKELAHKKFPGKVQTNGLHLVLSTAKRVMFEFDRIFFIDATTPKGTSVCVAAEVGPLGHLEYCFSFPGDKGFGKEHDIQPPPQTPPVAHSYDKTSGPLRKWETCIYRLTTNPKKPLQIFSAENGILGHELVAPPGLNETKAFFADVDCRSDGLTYLDVMKSSLSKDVAYDVFAVTYPPPSIVYRLQIMHESRKMKTNKFQISKFNICGDFLIGEGLKDEVMFFDLKMLMKEVAVFYPTGEADDPWKVPTYKIFDVQKPLFQTISSRKFVLFNPWDLPPYYITREKDSFVVWKKMKPINGEPAAPEDWRLGTIVLENAQDGTDPPPPQFLNSIQEHRIIFIDQHVLSVYTVATNDQGEYLQRIHTRDFCEVETENSLRVFGQNSSKRLYKNVTYTENCILNWDENSFLKQIAVVKYTDASVTCYVLDAFSLSELYCIEPRCFKPVPGVEMISVEFESDQIVVCTKIDAARKYFVFNLYGECHQRELNSSSLPAPASSNKKPPKRNPPHRRRTKSRHDDDQDFKPGRR